MPCKIQIKQNITSVIEDKTKGALDKTLIEAATIGNRVNDEFGMSVVSFYQPKDQPVKRDIVVPEELVNIYYQHELGMEEPAPEQFPIVPNVGLAGRTIETLERTLAEGFLKDFNITATEYESMKDDLGLDAYAAADVVTKAIAYQKGETILPEVAYFALQILGKNNNKIRGELRYLINNWNKYRERFDYHAKIIQAKEGFIADSQEWKQKIRDRVIIDFLKDTLYEYYKNPVEFTKSLDTRWIRGIDKMRSNSTFTKIIDWLEDTLRKYAGVENAKVSQLNNIGLAIADEILNQNYHYFNYELAEGQIQKQYNATINTDSFAKELVEFGQKSLGLVLTGSLALRRAGTVFRTALENLHDIDWVVPFSLNNNEENKEILNKIVANKDKVLRDMKEFPLAGKEELLSDITEDVLKQVQEFSWYKQFKEKYPGFVLTGGFYGADNKELESMTVQGVINPERYPSLGVHEEEHVGWTKDPITKAPVKITEMVKVAHQKGDIVKGTGYVIDFFVRFTDTQEEHVNYFKLWKEIMIAKLKMGRDKDFIDWKAFVPYIKSKDSYNFNYEGFRHINYESSPKYALEESREKEVMAQSANVQASKASKEQVEVIKEAAAKMGIDIMALTDYAKENPDVDVKDVNGVADLAKKTIGIAMDMEDVALTEEVIHIASAMIEQVAPKMITEMISKIDRYKIYNVVLEQYKNLKGYQLPNGKPDIRKIKKEAVDKLIAEVYLNPNPDTAQYPELLEPTPKNMAQRWWNSILDRVRGMYRQSDIDIYQRAGEIIASGELDASISPKDSGVYLQKGPENIAVNKIFDAVREHGLDTELVQELLDSKGVQLKKRHYLYKGIEALKSVTEKVKEAAAKKFAKPTEEKEAEYEEKRAWGDKGHKLIENFLPLLIDKVTGYRRETPLPDNITSDLPAEVERKVKNFIIEVVNSYPDGTRFLFEEKVMNTKVKGMLGGTVDLIILEPTKTKDDLDDVKVDVFDWKFTSLAPKNKDDIPWFKRGEWVQQMGEYTQILYNYGLKRNQLRKARMIPFIMNYEYALPGNRKSGLYPKSIEIGKLNVLEETNLYLLPVPINSETTGNPAIDDLLDSLREQYEKMYKEYVDPEEKDVKDYKLNQISEAIRNLHLKLNFEPLVRVANTFIDSAAKDILEYEKINYDTVDPDQLKVILHNMLSFINGAIKYQSLDTVYLSQYPKTNLTPEQKHTLEQLEKISGRARNMVDKINIVQTQVAISIAFKEGIDLDVYEDYQKNIRISPEIPINSLDKQFAQASILNAQLIQLHTQLTTIATKETNQKFIKEMDLFRSLVVPLEAKAKAAGKKAFNMIGTVTPSGLRLIRKFDSAFWDGIKEAKANGEKAKIMKHMDMDKFKVLADEAIAKQLDYYERVLWSSDEEENQKIKDYRAVLARDAIDITRPSFDGYQGFMFNQILGKVLKEEGNLSKDYMEMIRTPEALAVWEYFTKLNVDAKNMGYLSKHHSTSFFPLIEATILHKISQTGDFFGQLGRSIRELGLTNIDEKQNLAKVDAETGEPKKEIPKYFTASNKEVNQLSTDLTKVGSLWIKSLLDYQKIDSLESTLLTLLAVENAKGSIVVDPQGRIVEVEGKPTVRKENPNAAILQSRVDDFAYGLREDLSSVGSVKLAAAVGKFKKDEEAKQSAVVNIKKGLQNANIYLQAMGVGLKPLIGAANYVGTQLHVYINAGVFYTGKQFQVNHVRVVATRGLSSLEKALMMSIIPNERELMSEEQRKIASAKGDMSWVSTWSFSDVMMTTSSILEHRLALANALTFVENSMIVDGTIVPIRQYLLQQDRAAKYLPGVTEAQREQIEKSLDARVEQLKASSSLLKTCTFENGKLTIPGVSDREFAKFSLVATEFFRGMTGQMNIDDKAGYTRDTVMFSFFMFKHWIPPLVSQRGKDIRKNALTGEWEYGRTRVFLKTWSHLGFKSIHRMREITQGTEEGLKILDDMLEQKRIDYFKKNGKNLHISQEEFYDLMRSAISNELKELKALLCLLGMVLACMMVKPPKDAEALEKNRYKYFYKAIQKISDELSFYYNPISLESMTKGSIIPAVAILSKIEKFIVALLKEGTGYVIDDDEMIDKAYPLKYFFNLVPGLYQLSTEGLPLVFPDAAKKMGIRVTDQARRQ